MNLILRTIALATTAAIWLLSGASVGAAPPPRITWNSCYAQFGPFQCGQLQVPLDYSQRSAGVISLALVRLPASDPQHRIGSLLINPGGPGGSGVDFAAFAAHCCRTHDF